MRLAISTLALLLALPAPAFASSAVLLPRAGGSGASIEATARAVEALRSVLVNEGFELHDPAAVSAALPAHLSSCGPDDGCAEELRRMMRVDLAVGLRVWGEAERIDRLAVVVTGIRGVGHRALIDEVDADVPIDFAIAEGLRSALATWRSGRTAEPVEGYRAALGEPRATDSEASGLNWALGALLAAGAAPLLGFAIDIAIRDGNCATEAGGVCVETVSFEEGHAVAIALGAALLAAGIVVVVLQPIRVQVVASPRAAGLRIEGRF